ncbi:AEC family transporter [Orrella dioscoreae]|uniref:Putative membrane protein n=1 Tax=Orrella dioscoreae TaxID=1851544 RepID=A0A1C3K0H1_9BURK|nr:AEC family transporter [Orrella dioscoreae]SBT25002.1 putative membrane protein [Orrella dioscoreae]SOE51154.1 putative membrane protein [Orrella dioscoreae]
MSVLFLVMPEFLLVALGSLLRHRAKFSAEFFAGLERLVYFVLFPAMLFQSILRTPITPDAAADLFLGTSAVLGTGILLAMLARPLLRPEPVAYASAVQCGYRFNTYIGLALASNLAGSAGQTVMALIVGFAVPMANVAAVHALARQGGGRVFREILRNPLVIATLAGLVANLAGLRLPGPIDVVLARLGAAAVALGLLCVGASLSWQAGSRHGKLVGWMLGVKLLVLPGVALGVAQVLGLDPVERQMLLLFAALPTASTAYVLAVRMGGDGRLVALLISASTVLSAITIPIWLAVAG